MDLNHLHLHVADLPRSRHFYETYLGFQEHTRHGDMLFLRNAQGFELALAPSDELPNFPDWFHFGFRLADPAEVRALNLHMTSAHVPMLIPLFEEVEQVSFRCSDPDGYGVEVYWEPEVEAAALRPGPAAGLKEGTGPSG